MEKANGKQYSHLLNKDKEFLFLFCRQAIF